jgi:hypothetical protein
MGNVHFEPNDRKKIMWFLVDYYIKTLIMMLSLGSVILIYKFIIAPIFRLPSF